MQQQGLDVSFQREQQAAATRRCSGWDRTDGMNLNAIRYIIAIIPYSCACSFLEPRTLESYQTLGTTQNQKLKLNGQNREQTHTFIIVNDLCILYVYIYIYKKIIMDHDLDYIPTIFTASSSHITTPAKANPESTAIGSCSPQTRTILLVPSPKKRRCLDPPPLQRQVASCWIHNDRGTDELNYHSLLCNRDQLLAYDQSRTAFSLTMKSTSSYERLYGEDSSNDTQAQKVHSNQALDVRQKSLPIKLWGNPTTGQDVSIPADPEIEALQLEQQYRPTSTANTITPSPTFKTHGSDIWNLQNIGLPLQEISIVPGDDSCGYPNNPVNHHTIHPLLLPKGSGKKASAFAPGRT